MLIPTSKPVHYAGNLQIAASVFITLGLILSLALAALAVLRVPPSSSLSESEAVSNPLAVEGRRSSSVLAYTPVVLVFFLYIGAVLQVLAQFFGILGLIVNPTPNGGDATASQHKKLLNNFAAHEWVMDKGLTTYATVAWTSAVLCAVIATAVFRRSRVHTIKI
ncbi:hypothetical protein CC80DRAFT_229143 [Byssothecium circinans]|uniref:Uncharacterized protein n=1 Tax=Byssothecium circinans TaxID=147558 RepID=A0A6A5TNR7_9PLEO|nr:hypothetical protein CC80DRAFT_229143 [Byssothecium circinans]